MSGIGMVLWTVRLQEGRQVCFIASSVLDKLVVDYGHY